MAEWNHSYDPMCGTGNAEFDLEGVLGGIIGEGDLRDCHERFHARCCELTE